MRRIVPLLALLAGGLLAGLLLSETGYRIARHWVCVDGATTAPYVPDAVYGWRHRPGATQWLHGCVGRRFEWRTWSRINALGLHDGAHAYARQDGVPRVLLLGDSMTEALQVPIEEAFATLLEDEIRVDGGSVEVVNGAIAGFGTDSALAFFEAEGVRYAPDLVVLMFNAANDVLENSPTLHRAVYEGMPAALPPKPYVHRDADGRLRRVPPRHRPRARPGGLWETLTRHFYLARLLDRTLRTTAHESAARATSYGLYLDVHTSPMPAGWAESWALTDALIGELARTVAAHGARFVVAIIPTKREVSAGGPGKRVPRPRGDQWDLDQPTGTIAAILERRGIPYVSLRPALRAHFAASRSTGYFVVDPHFATDGHRVAADVLRPFVEAELQASLTDGGAR